MRNLLFRYSFLLLALGLFGYSQSYAHAPLKTSARRSVSLLTKPTPQQEHEIIKVAPIEVREEEEDRHESASFGKYIECSIYFNNALPQGYFFSLGEVIPAGNEFSHTSPDQYLLLRVFRI